MNIYIYIYISSTNEKWLVITTTSLSQKAHTESNDIINDASFSSNLNKRPNIYNTFNISSMLEYNNVLLQQECNRSK